jgi:hypothetical protein
MVVFAADDEESTKMAQVLVQALGRGRGGRLLK